MIIFHKINTAGSEQQLLKPFVAASPHHCHFPLLSPLGGPRLRAPGPEPTGNPSPAGRISYNPVIHPHRPHSRSCLRPQRNSHAGVQSQHLHPSLDGTEPAARTRAPGQAAVPGGAERARGSAPRYSLLLDALILATSFCTLGMSPFFTAWISSCSRPITDGWERQQRRRQRPSDPSCL